MCFRCNQCGLPLCHEDHDPWPKVGHISSSQDYNEPVKDILAWTEEQEWGGDKLYLTYHNNKKSNEAQWIGKLCVTCLMNGMKL